MLETVAIIGPARFGIPLTQAVTAPLLGRLEARGWRPLAQIARLRGHPPAAQHGHHGVLHLGDHRRPRRLRRHLRRHRPAARAGGRHAPTPWRSPPPACSYGRPSPAPSRCSSTAAACATGTGSPPDARQLTGDIGAKTGESGASRARPLRSACRGSRPPPWPSRCCWPAPPGRCWPPWRLWLALAWVAARPDREPMPAGLVFAALLAGGRLRVRARRRARPRRGGAARRPRAALLVLTATWLRGAAGAEGLREVSRRVLGRLRRAARRAGGRAGARPDRARRAGSARGGAGAGAAAERGAAAARCRSWTRCWTGSSREASAFRAAPPPASRCAAGAPGGRGRLGRCLRRCLAAPLVPA